LVDGDALTIDADPSRAEFSFTKGHEVVEGELVDA
jgi:hypothetical protein